MAGIAGKVLFYVQHLFGVGHLFRARRIAERLDDAGLTVTFVIGGMPVPDLDLPGECIFLPPVRSADAAFSRMTDGEGKPLTPDHMAGRAAMLLSALDTAEPDLILIEAFPFGRRFLRDEILGLLNTARRQDPSPLICCSVRDILQENRKAGRAEETAEIINSHFDLVLVHGDPAIVRLDATFPATAAIGGKIRYTGIVAGAAPGAGNGGSHGDPPVHRTDILVTAGGGAFGETLLDRAADAAMRDEENRRWLLVTGPNGDPALLARLRERAQQRVQTALFLPDLPAQLRKTEISVSQAGYNTVADLLGAPCRRVLVPSDAGGQTEQLRRANLLAGSGLCACLPESELTADRLLAAIAAAKGLPQHEKAIDLSGAETTARILCDALARRQA